MCPTVIVCSSGKLRTAVSITGFEAGLSEVRSQCSHLLITFTLLPFGFFGCKRAVIISGQMGERRDSTCDVLRPI